MFLKSDHVFNHETYLRYKNSNSVNDAQTVSRTAIKFAMQNTM